MATDDSFYQDPATDLCQGDIVDNLPHLHLKPPLQAFRQTDLPGKHKGWGSYPYPPVEGQTPDAPGKRVKGGALDFKKGELVSAFCQITRAILVNYECDLQPGREPDHCLIAMVRPIHVLNPDHRDIVRNNQNFSHFYLPPYPRLNLEEGYVDLHRITCVHPSLLELGKRRTSLTAGGLLDFQAALFRFFTRRDLKGDVIRSD
jgi:hypothetical protein